MGSGFRAATGIAVDAVGGMAGYVSRAVTQHTIRGIVEISGVLIASDSSASAATRSATCFAGGCTFSWLRCVCFTFSRTLQYGLGRGNGRCGWW